MEESCRQIKYPVQLQPEGGSNIILDCAQSIRSTSTSVGGVSSNKMLANKKKYGLRLDSPINVGSILLVGSYKSLYAF